MSCRSRHLNGAYILHWPLAVTLWAPITVYSLVRELLTENGADLYRKDYRITGEALLALQESAEMYMTQFFEDCNAATAHRGAATLNIRDLAIIQMLRRDR